MRITDPLPLKMRETSRISPGPERIRLSGPGFFYGLEQVSAGCSVGWRGSLWLGGSVGKRYARFYAYFV